MRRRWGIRRIAALGVAMLLVSLLLLAGVSYALYYSPAPADLPCRGCSGDAQAVRIGGFDLHYRSVGERGDKPPVVLLHGGPGMSSQTFKRGFDFLSDTYQVVYYDQRGSGNSQIKPDSSAYTIDQLVDELESLRRDVIRADQMVLVGHSAGGSLAQRYALKYTTHVHEMILVGALPANGGYSQPGVVIGGIVAMMYLASGQIPPADPEQANAWFADLSYRTSIPRLFDPRHPELIQDFGYYSFAVGRDITRSTYGGSYDEQLRKLSARTLIVYGEGDHSEYTGEPVARQMQSLLPNSRLVSFAHSGHWPYLEEPERFQEVVRGFLAE
jgi:proline iminopeptidase